MRHWDIGEYIPVGYEKRVSRGYLAAVTKLCDRDVRDKIENSKEIIVSADGGYFIPDLRNPIDVKHMNIYKRKELKRITTLMDKQKRLNQKIQNASRCLNE